MFDKFDDYILFFMIYKTSVSDLVMLVALWPLNDRPISSLYVKNNLKNQLLRSTENYKQEYFI